MGEELELDLKNLKGFEGFSLGKDTKTYATWAVLALIFFLAVFVRLPTMQHSHFIEPDSFWHFRFAEMKLESGTSIIEDLSEKTWDSKAPWPEGRYIPPEDLFMSTLLAKSYPIFGFGMPFLRYAFWFTPIMAALCIFPVYIIGRELFDRMAGLFAAFFFSVSPGYLTRTMAGIFDTDSLVLLFPLLIFAFFLLSYNKLDPEKPTKPKPLLYAILCGLFLAAFAFTWNGYWYAFWLMLGFVVLHTLYIAIFSKGTGTFQENLKQELPEIKSRVFIFLLVLAAFLVVTVPFIGFRRVPSPTDVISFTEEFKAGAGIYPNVWETVAEMQAPGDLVKETSGRVGQFFPIPLLPIGIPLFYVAIVVLFALAYFAFMRKKYAEALILLSVWMIGPLIPSQQAARFILLLTPPITLAAGIGFSMAWNYVLKYSEIRSASDEE